MTVKTGLTFGQHCGLLNEEECSVGFFLVQRLLVLSFRWFTPSPVWSGTCLSPRAIRKIFGARISARGKPQRHRF